MTATIGYRYSEVDKEFQYFVSCVDNWVWFGLGQTLLPEINIYPFIPSWTKFKSYELNHHNSHKLGNKCGIKLNKLYLKHNKK